MNELLFKNFDIKVLNNFHRVCRVREKLTTSDITELNYSKNSNKIVVGKTHYDEPSLICCYENDFRFNKDFNIPLYTFLKPINYYIKKIPSITFKEDKLILKYGSITQAIALRKFRDEYLKSIPKLDENKIDFSFKLNSDFFRTLEQIRLKLRHKYSFDITAFYSFKNKLFFTNIKRPQKKSRGGGLRSYSFETDIKTDKRFAVRLNSDQLKFLSNFFVSDYEVSSYENRKYLVFKNIYKPLKYFLFLTDKKLEPKPTPDSKEREIINHYAENQKRND